LRTKEINMKRNLAIVIAFAVGVLVGVLPSLPMLTHAQDQNTYKYVSPEEVKRIKDWADVGNARTTLEGQRIRLLTDAQDMLARDLKSLENVSEEGRQPLMEKIGLEIRALQAINAPSVESQSGSVVVTLVSPGSHMITGSVLGFSCAPNNGVDRCYVLSR
jgi:hypothetical protein